MFKKNIPILVQRELEQLQPTLVPIKKKSIIFGLISIPLVLFSLFNIYMLLLDHALNRNTFVIIGLLALLGAFGMSFLKESLFQLKKIHETSIRYIRERMLNSQVLPTGSKNKYVELLQSEEADIYQVFHDFLRHERRMADITVS